MQAQQRRLRQGRPRVPVFKDWVWRICGWQWSSAKGKATKAPKVFAAAGTTIAHHILPGDEEETALTPTA